MKDKPHILCLQGDGGIGGAERSLFDLLQALTHRANVSLWTASDGQLISKSKDIGIDTYTYPWDPAWQNISRTPWGLYFAWSGYRNWLEHIVKKCADKKISLVYSNTMKLHPVASMIGKTFNIPVIWHLRDGVSGFLAARTLHYAAKDRLDMCIANSYWTAREWTSIIEKEIDVVYNGIDTTENNAKNLRTEVNANNNQLLVVGSGMAHWKGFSAFARLAKRLGNEACCVWIGTDKTNTTSKYVNRIASCENAPSLISQADIFVHIPYQAEPFGRVIVEAMGGGGVPVVYDNGGVVEIIEGASGVCVPRNDESGVYNTVLDLIKNTEKRELYSENAKKIAARFSLENYQNEMCQRFFSSINTNT